jgi:hypothetical protein
VKTINEMPATAAKPVFLDYKKSIHNNTESIIFALQFL